MLYMYILCSVDNHLLGENYISSVAGRGLKYNLSNGEKIYNKCV